MRIAKANKAIDASVKQAQRVSTDYVASRSVQVKAPKPAPKPVSKPSSNGLENRGTKPTRQSQMNNARDLQWQRAERSYDARNEMAYTGLKGGPDATRNTAGRKLQNKLDKLTTIARDTVKVDSNPVPVRNSSSLSQEGRLGGQFAGGHGIETDELFGGGRPGQLK
jgi:cell division septation protein DedD